MKDSIRAYYTNSEPITSYMCSKLLLKNGDVVLEPSAGEGVFLDTILEENPNIIIDAMDIDDNSIKTLIDKYNRLSNVYIRKADTILDEKLDYYSCNGGYYDKIIGNPPYGAWQDIDKRELLKKKYPGYYIKETYTLFLLRCISLLKMHGRLCFIVPDTFLFLNLHKSFRQYMLTHTKVEEILVFPSKFFPGVNFGYSNLSIITLERATEEESLRNTIHIVKGFTEPSELSDLQRQGSLPRLTDYYLPQKQVLHSDNHRFIITENDTSGLLNSSSQVLGDVADVVTGLYTGDNLRFITAANSNVKGARKYSTVEPFEIFHCSSLSGIEGVNVGYIPYIKSAPKTRYFQEQIDWYVRWDTDAIDFYHNNKKSRFQNSDYYFKTGIGIPMVKSKSIKAFFMDNRVFDQAIVGIFPHDINKTNYILALMNSEIVNKLIHIINPTANNSANYVKKIPYIEPSKETIEQINQRIQYIRECIAAKRYNEVDRIKDDLDRIFNDIYSENNI